jgi:hypothetical protein
LPWNEHRNNVWRGVYAVAEVLPLSDAELELLKSLTDYDVRFMIVGLSAAAMQGAPVVTQDIDLWFEDLHQPPSGRRFDKRGLVHRKRGQATAPPPVRAAI